jgi:hypothetical protein
MTNREINFRVIWLKGDMVLGVFFGKLFIGLMEIAKKGEYQLIMGDFYFGII